MGYHYLNLRINSVNDDYISCKNFVNFRPVTSEKTGLICEPFVRHGKQETLLLQRDRARHLSVEILQLQNISLENPIVWHYLRDSTYSRFDTIPEQTHTHTHRQTDERTDTLLRCAVKIDHIALHTKYNYQATSVG